MASKKYQLNKGDFSKILTGAQVAIVGALITYLTQTVGDIDFGTWTPIATALSAILVNILRKWVSSQS